MGEAPLTGKELHMRKKLKLRKLTAAALSLFLSVSLCVTPVHAEGIVEEEQTGISGVDIAVIDESENESSDIYLSEFVDDVIDADVEVGAETDDATADVTAEENDTSDADETANAENDESDSDASNIVTDEEESDSVDEDGVSKDDVDGEIVESDDSVELDENIADDIEADENKANDDIEKDDVKADDIVADDINSEEEEDDSVPEVAKFDIKGLWDALDKSGDFFQSSFVWDDGNEFEVATYADLDSKLSAASTDSEKPTTIKLTADIQTEATLVVKEGTFVILDLNGYLLDRNGGNSRVFTVKGNLIVKDSRPENTHSPAITYTNPVDEETVITINGGMITGGGGGQYGAGLYVESTGTLVLEGGSVALNAVSSNSYYAGGIFVNGGTFIMDGGAICANKAQQNGGGVYATSNAKVTMNDGLIEGNELTYGDADGGGVYVYNGSEFIMNGGVICHNKSGQGAGVGMYNGASFVMNDGLITENKTTWTKNGGAGVNGYVCSAGFTMNGGEISKNIATGNGGGVLMNSMPFTMSGDAVIKENTSAASGGGLAMNSNSASIFTMSGNAVIKDNSSAGSGGGISGGYAIEMKDNALVEGNTASGTGGGIIHSGTLTMSGNASVKDNNSKGGKGGAGINISSGTLNLTENASVTGNVSEFTALNTWGGAGGIYNDSGTINMTGGRIEGNISYADGGGIGLYYYGTLNISGGTITNNHAMRRGGAVYNEDYDNGHLQVSGNPVIVGNTAVDSKDSSKTVANNIVQLGHSAKYVNVVGKLTDGAQIGVTTNSTPSASSPARVANDYTYYNNGDDPEKFFVSDAGYRFIAQDGEAKAVTPWQYVSVKLGEGGTYKLTEDIKAIPGDGGITVFSGVPATLDLNGHVLDGDALSQYVFYLRGSELNLTIIDSNPNAKHDPAVTYTNPVTGENVEVTGGVITGATRFGICASYGSDITMKGGTVVGNNAGVWMAGSTFTLEDGAVSGNFGGDGGGIFAYEATKLYMTGGEISCNTATGKGGGVYLYNNQSNRSDMHLSGGIIKDNISPYNGGGICVGSRGTLFVSGNPVVQGNKKITKDDQGNITAYAENNLFGMANIEGALTEGASIGATVSYYPGPGDWANIASGFTTYNSGDDPADFFTSDLEGYVVSYTYSGEPAIFSKCTISFDANGGTGSMSTITDYFGDYTLPKCDFTAPEGYRFVNWKIGRDKYDAGKVYRVTDNVTAIAQWELIPVYTVTYYENGGAALEQNTYSVREGDAFGTMPVPTKTGYGFAGWFTEEKDGTKVSSTDKCYANTSLYAHWTANTDTPFKVEHYLEKLDGEGFELAETENFTGTTDEAVTPVVKDYAGFTAPHEQRVTVSADGNTVVKYEYTRNLYSLTWDLDGGSFDGDYTSGLVKYEAAITAPVPEREGYIFGGWDAEVPEKMPTDSVTRKAIWLLKGRVIAEENGVWYLFNDGVKELTANGFVEINGEQFLIAKGIWVYNAKGLVQDVNNRDDWYFCANGKVVSNKSGLVQYPAGQDKWFIVQNGKLDTTYSGFVDYNGGKFFVARGKLVRKDGLVQDPNHKADWYFLSGGQVQKQKTGVVIYNKAGFYVVKGKLDTSFTGTVPYGKSMVKIVKGRMV